MSGAVIWLTGRPASGKSTLAARVRDRLARDGVPVCVLDGDEVRDALVPRPGYEPAARSAFYATLARLAALLARQGLAVLVPATAHRRAYREDARAAAPAFVEVYVATPAAECAVRDVKGLYASARSGAVRGLPGVDVEYEEPERPDVIARGGHDEQAAQTIVALVRGLVT